MKTAVFSDIHANPAALLKALNSARRLGCKKFICCGDVVGYGYAPNACIEICKQNNIECIKGNHDAALVGEMSLDWFNPTARDGILSNRPLVTEENKKWLANLPYTIEKQFAETKVAFSHGTYLLPERFEYINDQYAAATEMDVIRNKGIDALFVGHTHGAEFYSRTISTDTNLVHGIPPRSSKNRLVTTLNGWSESIFNVGSVGYPRRSRYSYYVIIDDETKVVEWRRLPFDCIGYINQLQSQGRQIPVWLQARVNFQSGTEAGE